MKIQEQKDKESNVKMQCLMMEAKIPKQQETYNALITSISHQRSGLLQIKNSVMLTKHGKFAKYTHDCIDNF